MDITFSNRNSINISTKLLNIAINPEDQVKADLLLFSSLTDKKHEARFFCGPGEYEVLGCMVDGIYINTNNTAYSLVVEDMNICYMVDLEEALSDKQVEQIDGVDVLIVSVKDDQPELMNRIIAQITPRVMIPLAQNQGALDKIKTEIGQDVEAIERFKLTKKDLIDSNQELVILK